LLKVVLNTINQSINNSSLLLWMIVSDKLWQTNSKKGPSWSWLYGSSIYNFLCNQCLSLYGSLNPTHGGVYSIQHYVIKFVSDMPEVFFEFYILII
jgi:hypothetical protein